MLLSLDVGFKFMGYSIWHQGQVVDFDLISTIKSGRKGVLVTHENIDRIKRLTDALTRLILKNKIQGVIGEAPHGGSQTAVAAREMATGLAVAVSVCQMLNVPDEWATPQMVKTAICGNPWGEKKEIMDRVADIFGFNVTNKAISIEKGKRKGKTSIKTNYELNGKSFPKTKFEHIADSFGAYLALKNYNLVKIYG